MPTVAERLRRLRRRSNPDEELPSWLEGAVDGPTVLAAFRVLPLDQQADYAHIVAKLRLRAAFEDLLQLLRRGSDYVEPAKAIQVLARDDDVPQLLEHLAASTVPEQRMMWVYTLMAPGLRPSPQATLRLLDLASDPRESGAVRGMALEALVYHPPRTRRSRDRTARVIRQASGDDDPEVVENAAWAAGAFALAQPACRRGVSTGQKSSGR